MNCVQFRFPQVAISLEFSASGRKYIGEDYYYEWSAAGTFSYTNTFDAGRKLKYGIANNCNWNYYNPDYPDQNHIRSCVRKGHLCDRFSLIAINSGTLENQYLYCGQGSVSGSATLNSNPPSSLSYDLYLNGNERTGNFWNISNLKPWDNADPFYYRNLQMYEAKSVEEKKVSAIISGYSNSFPAQSFPYPLLFEFSENEDNQYGVLSEPSFPDTATGTAQISINIVNAI
jgi:hypothetical protein